MTDPNTALTPDPVQPDVTMDGDIHAGIANISGIQVFHGDVSIYSHCQAA
jgi:hypothetical protein